MGKARIHVSSLFLSVFSNLFEMAKLVSDRADLLMSNAGLFLAGIASAPGGMEFSGAGTVRSWSREGDERDGRGEKEEDLKASFRRLGGRRQRKSDGEVI